MATGGQGNILAEASVIVHLNDKPMRSGLSRLQSDLGKIGTQFAKAFNFNLSGPTAQVNKLNAAMSNLNRNTHSAAAGVRALGSALRSLPRGMSSGLIRAMGAGQAAQIRAIGQGLGSAFRGLTSGLGTGLGRAANGFGGGLAKAIRATAAPIRAVGSAFASIARGFGSLLSSGVRAVTSLLRAPMGMLGRLMRLPGLLGLGGGIAGGLGAVGIARAAMGMESQQAELGRLTGLQGKGLSGLMGSLKSTAATTPGVSLSDTFDVAKIGARMGIAGNQLRLFTRDMLAVKVALGDTVPIEEFTEKQARLLNVFKLGITQARGFSSALVGLDNASTASGRDILDITTRLAPSAQLLGMKAPQSMALAAAARESGANPEVAGTALSQILGRMVERDRQGAFGKIAGVSGRQFTAMRQADPLEAVRRVAEGLGKMDATSGVEALESIGIQGQRARQVLLGLAATTGKLAEFTRIATGEFRSMAAVQSAVDLKAQTASAQWAKMGNNIRLAAAAIGEALLPVVKGAAEGVANFAQDIQRWAGRNQAALTAWGERLGNAIRMVGVLMRQFGDFKGLAGSFLMEGFDRIGKFLIDNVKFAFGDLMPKLIANTLGGTASLLGDLFSKIVARLGEEIHNIIAVNLPSWLGGGGKVLPMNQMTPITPDASKFGNPLAGVDFSKAPGFGAFFDKGLSRENERAPFLANIQKGMADQAAERRRASGLTAIGDLFTRATAPENIPGLLVGAGSFLGGAMGVHADQPRRRRSRMSPAGMEVMAMRAQARQEALMMRGLTPRRVAPEDREPAEGTKEGNARAAAALLAKLDGIGKTLDGILGTVKQGGGGGILGIFGQD